MNFFDGWDFPGINEPKNQTSKSFYDISSIRIGVCARFAIAFRIRFFDDNNAAAGREREASARMPSGDISSSQ